MKKIEAVEWVEKKVGNQVVAAWLDKDGKEIASERAFYKGDVYVRDNTALTSLTMPSEVGGDVYVYNNAALTSLTMPSEVGGYVYVRDNTALTSLTMPSEVGGYVYVDNNAALTSLTMPSGVGGYVYVYNNAALTSLTMPSEVGGYVSVYNNAALTSLTMPSEVGGYVYVDNNAALEKYTEPKRGLFLNHKESLRGLIAAKLLLRNILFADGIMAHIISSKNHVYKIRIFGKKEISYCVYRNGNFSHGETVRQAIESLKYKASIRDTEEFKSWKLSDVKTIEELISAYRSITGACETGVKMFCESINAKDKYTIEEVVKLTSGKYNHEQFKNFEWSN